MAMIKGISIGAVFGFALEKSKVYLPVVIREQMKFQSYTMLKVFLMAASVGTLGMTLLDVLHLKKRGNSSIRNLVVPYGANIIGGAILGMGMTISGACPGTVYVQMGAGVVNSAYVFAGGMLGCLLYGYFEKRIQNHLVLTSIDHFGATHPRAIPVIFASILAAIVFGVEKYSDFVQDYRVLFPNFIPREMFPSLNALVWQPIIAGAIIGSLQIPSLLLLKLPLGTSTSFCTLAGGLACRIDPKVNVRAPYLARFFGVDEFSKIGMVVGMATGGFLSTYLSEVPKAVLMNEVPRTVLFLSGTLLVFGARLANGCPSGHGLSGMAGLSIPSVVTVASMFAGGIAAASFM